MKFVDQNRYNNNISAAMLMFSSAMVTGEAVEFFAFLTSYTENYSSDWNIQATYGRTDPIANFRGNTRTLSVGWDIPAATLEEATINLSKFNKLNKLIYPYYDKPSGVISNDNDNAITYSSNALSLAKSPLIRLKFANLIQAGNGKTNGLLGYITSLSWNPVIEMGMFTGGGKLYPKVVSLNIGFGVLHEYDRGFFAKSNVEPEEEEFDFDFAPSQVLLASEDPEIQAILEAGGDAARSINQAIQPFAAGVGENTNGNGNGQ